MARAANPSNTNAADTARLEFRSLKFTGNWPITASTSTGLEQVLNEKSGTCKFRYCTLWRIILENAHNGRCCHHLVNTGGTIKLRVMRRCFVSIFLCLIWSLFISAESKPNIILITMTSTRSDRMGFLGSKAKLTPNLDGLARHSLVFERAYAQAPSTVVSDATILSGTYPQTHQVTPFGSVLGKSLPFLPAILHDQGYRTSAFAGPVGLDPREAPVSGFDRGFDSYTATFLLPPAGETRRGTPASQENQARAWIAQNAQHAFFLWINLNNGQASSGPSATREAPYDRKVFHADAEVGRLLDFLRAHNLYENALLIVTASEGESLGAHGEDGHGVFVYDETIHVPLLIKLPRNQMAAKRISGRVRLVDIAPTVLELAGLPVPSQMEGQSLLRVAKTSADEQVYAGSQYPRLAFGWSELQSWRAGKFLFVRAPHPELYDLNSDPAATHNLSQSSKATLDTLAAQLDAFNRHFSADNRGQTGLSSAEMQKLASLGYVGLQKSNANLNSATGTDAKDVIATANQVDEAMVAINNGQPEKAVSALQAIVAAQPNLYLPQYELGVAQVQLHKYAEAIEHLRKAIEIQSESPWAHYEIGFSLLKTGDFKSAAIYLEIVVSHLPQFAGAHSLLAAAYDHLGRGEDAKRERGKAAQLAH